MIKETTINNFPSEDRESRDKKRAILLLPGAIQFDALGNLIDLENDYVIAVDGGINKASSFNLIPDIWIGDFDSATPEEIIRYRALNKETHPEEKSEVDTELAINHAIRLGFREILFIGGIGGRVDHQLTLMLLPLQYRDLHFSYTDGAVWLQTLEENREIQLTIGINKLVSILPLETLQGITLKGTKWELDSVTLKPGLGLSVSNRSIKSTIIIQCYSGRGWICYYF